MTLLTITETASRLRVSPSMVRRLVKKHKDSISVSFGSKSIRIIAENLDKFVVGNVGKVLEVAPIVAKRENA